MLEVKRASTVFARYDERTWVRPIDEGNAYPSRPRDELRIALTVQRHRDPWRHRKLNLHPYIPSAVGPHTRLVNTKGVSSKFGKVVRLLHFHFTWLDLSDRKVFIELFDLFNSAVVPSFELFETRTNQTSKCWQGYGLLEDTTVYYKNTVSTNNIYKDTAFSCSMMFSTIFENI